MGVLPALSKPTRLTRLCLEPDLGVMLLLKYPFRGDAVSSLLLLKADSDRCNAVLDSGVVTEAVWCWGVRRPLAAIFGVRGCLFSALVAPALREGVGALEPA